MPRPPTFTRTAAAAAAALAAFAAAPLAHGQPEVTAHVITAGGGASTGGGYSLTGAIGQHDANPAAMTGGGYSLTAGFWPGAIGGHCPADWDNSGAVNSSDISAFITSWLASVQTGTLAADFDGNGIVNSSDISAFITAWLGAIQSGC